MLHCKFFNEEEWQSKIIYDTDPNYSLLKLITSCCVAELVHFRVPGHADQRYWLDRASNVSIEEQQFSPEECTWLASNLNTCMLAHPATDWEIYIYAKVSNKSQNNLLFALYSSK